MLRLVGILCLCVVVAQAETTTVRHHNSHSTNHLPHTTVEPLEKDQIKFIYDHQQHMIVHNGHDCYVVTLTDDEKVAVHTDSGLRDLELKILGLMASATTVTKDTLHRHEVDINCGTNIRHYFTIP